MSSTLIWLKFTTWEHLPFRSALCGGYVNRKQTLFLNTNDSRLSTFWTALLNFSRFNVLNVARWYLHFTNGFRVFQAVLFLWSNIILNYNLQREHVELSSRDSSSTDMLGPVWCHIATFLKPSNTLLELFVNNVPYF